MEERLTHLSQQIRLFSHDGIHDSQTHLAAPPFFYEQLRRELALSGRTKISFCAVRITFDRDQSSEKVGPINSEDILRFSTELRSLTRTDECIGRLGINECVVLVRDGEVAALRLISRLRSASSLSIDLSLRIDLSMVTSLYGETGIELLNRLDEAPLSTT